MALKPEQRAELEALGPDTVRIKLIAGNPGRGADVFGFKTGIEGGCLTRGDVEDWLIEKRVEEATMVGARCDGRRSQASPRSSA
jgi:hypothetical protein